MHSLPACWPLARLARSLGIVIWRNPGATEAANQLRATFGQKPLQTRQSSLKD